MLGNIEVTEMKVASRWSRFWAWFIDGLVACALMIPLFYFEPTRNLMFSNDVLGLVSTYVFSAFLYLLCHGYLLHKYGQTIGKNVFEIAMFSTDSHQPLSLSKFFFMRWVPFSLIILPARLYEIFPTEELFKLLSLLAILVAAVNILLIFGKQKRCLHDRFAGSLVVDVSKPRKIDFSEA
ncbi:RDD family protein [Vibrio fortis]|uniref:RDD family protein n=1 Tax=Vibrio fortis TaxID=212667 RepID=A0A5N3S3L3_9VIBR|nr:RDD family protein [Vibrio fortis]KAB0300501.1 RDD family protein [Vibrio fortis]